MKYRTTEREQRENNSLILKFGYCAIQNLERYLTANAYTCGIYGWKADFYDFGGFTISTGYAPMELIRFKADKKRADYIKAEILKLERKLEARAYAFQKSGDWNKGKKQIEKMLEKIYKKSLEKFAE